MEQAIAIYEKAPESIVQPELEKHLDGTHKQLEPVRPPGFEDARDFIYW